MKPIPKFQSLEDEREYWEARGPLAEGHKGRLNRSERRRLSFLNTRLTGEELAHIHALAVRRGIGASTLVRLTLFEAGVLSNP